MHIFIPLQARYSYEQSKHLGEIIAHLAHQRLPRTTSIERNPKKRQKKVYIDFLQNNRGQTIVAPYSLRAKSSAPISTPLDWKEVKSGIDPRDYNLKNILKRIEKRGDLFKPALGKGIDLLKVLKSDREIMKREPPLSELLRPKTLDEVVGQKEAISFIQSVIKKKKPLSILLWGPPGSGKTTIARLYAKAFDLPFESISAVFSGVC